MISNAPVIHKGLRHVLCLSTLILALLNGVVYCAETNTVNAAKKEGEIILYTVMSADNDRVMVEAFQKKYAGIPETSWRGGAEAMLTRHLQQARAGAAQP